MLIFRHCFLTCLLLLLLLSNCHGQDIDGVILRADSLYESKNYQGALLEYQRARYFIDQTASPSLIAKSALCYYSLGEISKSRKYFDEAEAICEDDCLRMEILLLSVNCDIENHNFYGAVKTLEAFSGSASAEQQRYKNFYQGVANWGLNDFEQAFDFFAQSLSRDDTLNRAEIVNLKNQYAYKLKQKPSILPVLSSIIPGSGQVISGNTLDGIVSFLLCGGIGVVGIGSIVVLQNNVVFFNLSPWFLRYYFGGISQTISMVQKSRFDIKEMVFDEIISIISSKEIPIPSIVQGSMREPNQQLYEPQTGWKILDGIFNTYKRHISPQDILDCVYSPSCSIYSVETIKQNGFWGLFDAIDRLTRCHLFGHSEYPLNSETHLLHDPVIDISKSMFQRN